MAKTAISKDIRVCHETSDLEYLSLIKRSFKNSIEEFSPNFIIYNAGTDCIHGDPLGSKII